MAHLIQSNDGAAFYKTPAWHGLGRVIDTAMSPSEALVLAGLDWSVIKSTDISVTGPNGGVARTSDYAAIVRSDTKEILSIQSARYEPIQNAEQFELAYALGSSVKVESAFSMLGGRRVVCLCRGDSFAPSNSRNDEVHRYLALINSHDGSYTMMVFPTSIRVVCNNTASEAIGEAKRKGRAFSIRHKGNMEEKLQRVADALAMYAESGDLFRKAVNTLSHREMNTLDIQKFWIEVYGALYQPVVANPKSEQERANNAEAASRIAGWAATFDDERARLGAPASLWQAANAVTRDIQHGKRRASSEPNARPFSNLIGTAQDETMLVLNKALALV